MNLLSMKFHLLELSLRHRPCILQAIQVSPYRRLRTRHKTVACHCQHISGAKASSGVEDLINPSCKFQQTRRHLPLRHLPQCKTLRALMVEKSDVTYALSCTPRGISNVTSAISMNIVRGYRVLSQTAVLYFHVRTMSRSTDVSSIVRCRQQSKQPRGDGLIPIFM